MIPDRQKRLLSLLDALGGEVGRLDFQKLLLLYCLEVEESPSFEFVPYQYGGFSFTSYADMRRLIERGFLEDAERTWKLTASGKDMAKTTPWLRKRMDEYAGKRGRLRGNALIAEAYRRYPYYAIRSRIADRILSRDDAALRAVRAARPLTSGPGLCTIGYEGRTLEGFLNCLLQDGVNLLCDVRRNPISRKYGFSKSTLSTACEGVGIQYEHLPELGIASEERRNLNTQSDYDTLFATYNRENLPMQGEALSRILGWMSAGSRVALTCYERFPFQCHRHCVAEFLEKTPGNTRKAKHL
jgi:uncharacterized protein (DUF488 family)